MKTCSGQNALLKASCGQLLDVTDITHLQDLESYDRDILDVDLASLIQFFDVPAQRIIIDYGLLINNFKRLLNLLLKCSWLKNDVLLTTLGLGFNFVFNAISLNVSQKPLYESIVILHGWMLFIIQEWMKLILA